ncbi:MAG: negative transcriptional regulator [Alphaproteobacteria bacterium HGW-Alphaproteobacteria-2]|nr:MAG: negative transcriptional regulator [Alphaproteobacteria bacterium HGW-Alphaproteobacteria-2]
MHPNPAFRQTPAEQNLAFARERGFGILTVSVASGPLAAHVPFLLSPDGAFAECHLARSNPIARAALPAPALMIVAGPDAYISPDWYGTPEQIPDQVPTWNYIAVHLRGQLEALAEAALEPHLDALSAEHEARLSPKRPWTKSKMSPPAMPRMMRAILPFRLSVDAVEGTWKLSQNKPQVVRERAGDALARQPGAEGNAALAALMRRT